jgi:tetratricopeptide (TPR) repeat protein
MTQKVRIFLSSTTEDFGEIRTDLAEQLRRFGYEPIFMGEYSAGIVPPIEKVLADVASCQLYVGLFGFRYGEPVERYGRSHTELEYREAIKCGIPTLNFVLDERVEDWPIRWVDRGQRGVLMEKLRAELLEQTTYRVCLFEKTKDLLITVLQAVADASANLTTPVVETRDIGTLGEVSDGKSIVGLRFQDVRNFKDRQEELKQIEQSLINQKAKLFCVVGRSGAGKTALASRLGEELEAGYQLDGISTSFSVSGIVYFPCRRSVSSIAERLFYEICRMLPSNAADDLRKIWLDAGSSDEEKFQELVARFQHGCYVIFLDGFEVVLGEDNRILDESLQAFVEVCLRTPHKLRLVTTSNQTFTIPHDVRHYVKQINLDRGLPDADGVALLRELDSGGELGLLSAPDALLLQLVVRCQGLPRALIGIVGLLSSNPTLSVKQLLASEGFWKDLAGKLVEEQYNGQSRDRQCVLEALAVYDNKAPLEAVAYLVNSFFPRVDVPSCLLHLLNCQVITASREQGTYEIQPLLQDYAYRRISQTGEPYNRQACHQASADFFVSRRKPQADWKHIDDVQPQLDEFDQRVRGGQFDSAADVLASIDDEYLQVWGRYRQLIAMREQLLGKLADTQRVQQNHGSLALSYRRLGRLNDAVTHFQRAIDSYQDDPRALADLHTELGNTLADMVVMSRAIEEYHRAIAIAKACHYLLGEARALGNLAIAHRQLGQIDEAVHYYNEAIQRDRRRLAEVLTELERRTAQRWYMNHVANLGKAFLTLGDIQNALSRFEEVIELARGLDYAYAEACFIHHLAETAVLSEDYDKAIEHCLDAVQKLRNLGESRNQSYALLTLARARHHLGQTGDAQGSCEEGKKLKAPETRYAFLTLGGIIAIHTGDTQSGHAQLSQAIIACNELIFKSPHFYEALYGRALAELASGLCDESIATYHIAQNICSAPGVRRLAIGELKLLERAIPATPGLEAARTLLEKDLPPLH